MKRLVLALTAVCLCDLAPAQDLAQQGVPASVLRIYEKTKSDLRRTREEYDKANEKILAEFNKTVKKEVDRLSKAGNPEDALALKDSAEAWFQQALGGGGQKVALQMPASPEDKRKNPDGRVRLVDIKPVSTEGVWAVEENHDGQRPVVNEQVTTEQFIYTHAPSKLVWEVPEGKKWFRAYAYYFSGSIPDEARSVVMEVRADGVPIARSGVLTIKNRLQRLEAKIPFGTKTLTLVTDPNGATDWDLCAWIYPSFFDR